MAINASSYKGTRIAEITAYIEANPGCTVADLIGHLGTTENSVQVLVSRIRERVWDKYQIILTYQKPDGLRFEKDQE